MISDSTQLALLNLIMPCPLGLRLNKFQLELVKKAEFSQVGSLAFWCAL